MRLILIVKTAVWGLMPDTINGGTLLWLLLCVNIFAGNADSASYNPLRNAAIAERVALAEKTRRSDAAEYA